MLWHHCNADARCCSKALTCSKALLQQRVSASRRANAQRHTVLTCQQLCNAVAKVLPHKRGKKPTEKSEHNCAEGLRALAELTDTGR